MFWSFILLVHIKIVVNLTGWIEQKGPQRGAHGLWSKSGGVWDGSLDAQGQLLDPELIDRVLVVGYHSTVINIFPPFWAASLNRGSKNLPLSAL